MDRLQENGISNIAVTLSGWNQGGYHGASYGSTKFEKQVGTKKEIQALRERLEGQGGSLALILNVMTANEDQINVNRDAALNATLNSLVTTIPNKSLMYQKTYYLHHAKTLEYMNKAFEDLEGFDLLLEDAAKYLYADYAIRHEVTRDEVQKDMVDTVESAKQGLLFDATNLYLLKYADKITDIPVSNSQYVYETDSVPFLQMVLRGSVDYYAPYSNLGFYSNASVLKMIEYGAYPSFMVMGAENFTISDTPLENYFSLNYEDWEARIVEVYGKINDALSRVKGAAMTDHFVVSDGVYCSCYDNNLKIYVNYNEEDYVTENGVTVPAGGYVAEEAM